MFTALEGQFCAEGKKLALECGEQPIHDTLVLSRSQFQFGNKCTVIYQGTFYFRGMHSRIEFICAYHYCSPLITMVGLDLDRLDTFIYLFYQ